MKILKWRSKRNTSIRAVNCEVKMKTLLFSDASDSSWTGNSICGLQQSESERVATCRDPASSLRVRSAAFEHHGPQRLTEIRSARKRIHSTPETRSATQKRIQLFQPEYQLLRQIYPVHTVRSCSPSLKSQQHGEDRQ